MNTTQTWTIDPTHTEVSFAARHLMISTVKGRFADVKGTVEIPATGEPKVDVTIGTASIDTRTEQRDAHLRSPDFFDVEKYPEIRFVSTKAVRTDDGWKVTGDLSMHGVTKPVTLNVAEEGSVRDPWGNDRMGFSARGKLDRREFGLTWNAALEAGGVVVGDEIKLHIDAELVRQAAAVQAA
jgi:polyisoprenoid-binding protein YceI